LQSHQMQQAMLAVNGEHGERAKRRDGDRQMGFVFAGDGR
jgi:hypothetical protein